jgi:hypothetical protein
MKKLILIVLMILAIPSLLLASDVRVNGYWRDSNGDGVKDTYVQPYHRTAPDHNLYNNYSTQGNINPYTSQQGTVDPYNNPYQQRNRW